MSEKRKVGLRNVSESLNDIQVEYSGRRWSESGGFISLVQLLIHPEDIGLIVDLQTDKLSSPTLLYPTLEKAKRGRGENPTTPAPPAAQI